jgi:hypothetical protein
MLAALSKQKKERLSFDFKPAYTMQHTYQFRNEAPRRPDERDLRFATTSGGQSKWI